MEITIVIIGALTVIAVGVAIGSLLSWWVHKDIY
jgi:hypothetical protein